MNLRYIFKRIRNLAVLCIAFTATGCLKEQPIKANPATDTGDGEVNITVHIPGVQTPETRSIAGNGGEAVVSTIDLLVFGKDGSGEVLVEHSQGSNIDPSGGNAANNYLVQFKAKIRTNTSATTVVIVANASSEVGKVVNASGTNSAYGKRKGDILTALTYASANSAGIPDGWKWKTNAANAVNPKPDVDYTPIPMYGEYDVTQGGTNAKGITGGMSMDGIKLVRMLARIDVTNKAGGFTLSKVSLVNYNTAGYLAPAWDASTGMLLKSGNPGYPYDTNGTPQIPASANKQAGAANALHYTYPANGGLIGEIYAYEAAATTGVENTTGHTAAACLIMEGTLGGNTYFYRIDFTDSKDATGKIPGEAGFNPSTVKYMPLYRNHWYAFEIKSVDGPGYGSFNEALRSPGLTNNMKTSLLIIDKNDIGIKDVVFDSNHFLGVGDEVEFDPGSGVTVLTPIITNYSYGWQIDKTKGQNGIEYISGGTGWLQAVKDGSDADLKANLKITAPTSNIGSTIRAAWVHLKAGMLTHKLKVTQECGTIRVNPSSLTLPASVTGNSPYFVTVTCTNSKGEPTDLIWTLEAGDSWLSLSDNPAGTGKLRTFNGKGNKTVYLFAEELATGNNGRFTQIYLNDRNTKVVDVKQLWRFNGAGTPISSRTYTGAFWRAEQTGERLIRIYEVPAEAAGSWSVSVLDYGDFEQGDIVFSTDPSADPNIGTNNAADMYTSDAVYTVAGGQQSVSGTVATKGEIFFRIGLKSKWNSSNPNYSASKPVRYATIVIWYNNHTKVQKLYLRQGHEADYLMRKGDLNGSGTNVADNRSYARPFVPYNLTHPDLKSGRSAGGANVANHPKIPARANMLSGYTAEDYFTKYPSQAGAYFQWANANEPRRAYHPANPTTAVSITGWQNNQPAAFWDTIAGNNETCPPGYRRPNDGSTSEANYAGAVASSEMRQSIWLNPFAGNAIGKIDNSIWGYYADGFFDRRPIVILNDIAAVSNTTAYAAYQGRLFFNPLNHASLFFPAAGERNYFNGQLGANGKNGQYWSSSVYHYNYTHHWLMSINLDRPGVVYNVPSYAYSIRCIKE